MNHKIKIPRGWEIANKGWGTINPAYSNAHTNFYESKLVCDCNWGRCHTVKLIVIRRKKGAKV